MEKLYTIKEAAEILGFHYQTVWKMIKEGRLKAVQPCGKRKKGQWRIREEDLKEVAGG